MSTSFGPSPPGSPGLPAARRGAVLGTTLEATSYAGLTECCLQYAREGTVRVVDFTNTHIVTLRRHDAAFREMTSGFDHFIPDGMPLVWCLNLQGLRLRDRVYGPTFMRECILASPATTTHYFLGGDPDCLKRLEAQFRSVRPTFRLVGSHHGYFRSEDEAAIVAELNQLAPDFIWVGLGTPKQQDWIRRHRRQLRRGVLFAVGFAFDVNAATKPDAPLWMQRVGLTWFYRMASEPRRLLPRYLKYNSLFLLYLLWDSLRGRAFSGSLVPRER